MKLGILGGTFDPIHRGHMAMAKAARQAMGLDRVLLTPTFLPPHKPAVSASSEHRLAMVRIAARGADGLEACDLEIRRGGVSYTVDTLEEVSRLYPGAEIYFIIGMDSLPELPRWRNLKRLLELAQLITISRPGEEHSFLTTSFPGIPEPILRQCEKNRVAMEPVPAASREIRKCISEGKTFEAYLPPGVGDYIRAHGLYGYQSSKRRA
ncbi:MAG: nicotinate (nicotinamide) nucleotide adenylyltransferase [Planctomycetes bacterium]|nr:nicotinate (nicotinamide) nucleotide adenylyltransferase [Planctomycetota bacterium]